MVNTAKQFFKKYIQTAPNTSDAVSEHSLNVATAALLIEMMRADAKASDEEHSTITKLIRTKFKLTGDETNTLIKLAEDKIWKSTGYYEFTSLINKEFTYEQKIKVIEHLWEVAFADKNIDKYEEHMVRKISDLIYVEHKDFINAKIRVRDRHRTA
ncbi:MAG: hypothetical protein A2Y97_08155 [Nitrospirae bacterium RBG_13_39_12]|nr:MAG: hypothetical protein A2Y97_08155 [Nitrospirae bacterium RBG_13_39_12]